MEKVTFIGGRFNQLKAWVRKEQNTISMEYQKYKLTSWDIYECSGKEFHYKETMQRVLSDKAYDRWIEFNRNLQTKKIT